MVFSDNKPLLREPLLVSVNGNEAQTRGSTAVSALPIPKGFLLSDLTVNLTGKLYVLGKTTFV